MRRLLAALALVAIAGGATSAAAQDSGRTYKIGWLTTGRAGLVVPSFEKWTNNGAALREALKDNGFVAGRNIVVESRHASGDQARLPAEAAALVASGVDVIVTLGTPPTAAAMQASKTTPVVFIAVGDPVEKGLVASLGRPGGNVTGMAVLIAGPKLWQNLREAAPDVVRAGYVTHARGLAVMDRSADFLNLVQSRIVANANAVGIEPLYMQVQSLEQIDARFAELTALGKAGALISQEEILTNWRKEILALALRHRLPTTCGGVRDWADAGCLVTYVEDYHAIWRGAGIQIAKVLKGIKPTDIPVEQPTTYKVVINRKTARELGREVPALALAKADEVIDD